MCYGFAPDVIPGHLVPQGEGEKGWRPRPHTQRRRKANASAANPTGATPAIQSQWTERSKRGLMVALASMPIPTHTAAQNREDRQFLGPTVATAS